MSPCDILSTQRSWFALRYLNHRFTHPNSDKENVMSKQPERSRASRRGFLGQMLAATGTAIAAPALISKPQNRLKYSLGSRLESAK
jgi:hypothetical protein